MERPLSELLPDSTIDRAVGAAGGTASPGAKGLATQRDGHCACFERQRLALARRPARVEIRRQHAGPFHATQVAAFDAKHFAVVNQQELGLPGKLPLEHEFRRCLTRGDRLLAEQGVRWLRREQVAARQAAYRQEGTQCPVMLLSHGCRACHPTDKATVGVPCVWRQDLMAQAALRVALRAALGTALGTALRVAFRG